jgi:hypothetical protein
VIAKLAAGSSSGDRRKAVPYAGVHQLGEVRGGPGGKTSPHRIRARAARYEGGRLVSGALAFKMGGGTAFATSVFHPGSKFRKLEYLKITAPRIARSIDGAVDASGNREMNR